MLARTTTWGCPVSSSIWLLEQPGAVVQLVQQLRSHRYRVREPHGDVTTS